jgi:hypothetical protein
VQAELAAEAESATDHGTAATQKESS